MSLAYMRIYIRNILVLAHNLIHMSFVECCNRLLTNTNGATLVPLELHPIHTTGASSYNSLDCFEFAMFTPTLLMLALCFRTAWVN